ncbi:hypothetical protein SAMN05444851_2666 [Aliiroseovarius sediminilitoris]|uniref:AAA+ family ATPase n=2 Tax=Aliiroseovarius sediminilitoris TaxID=1173584 RepID=A0A1I0QL04_9RHOB|nr:hypothetical protein SAMN05444851_2666 [Aliiroseovarius sediminilitoris]
MQWMKQIAKTTVLTLIAIAGLTIPTMAAEKDSPSIENPELSEGAELLNRGFQLLLEGLAKEVEPMADKWAEGWAELVERFGDLNAYYPPETLPNGDIIIRRRTPPEVEATPPSETEL